MRISDKMILALFKYLEKNPAIPDVLEYATYEACADVNTRSKSYRSIYNLDYFIHDDENGYIYISRDNFPSDNTPRTTDQLWDKTVIKFCDNANKLVELIIGADLK